MKNKAGLNEVFFSTISRFSYQIVTMLILFFLTPFLIKKLGNYHFGIWVLVSVIVNYYGYTELGINSSVRRNLAVAIGTNNKYKFNNVFINGLFLNNITLLLVLFITGGTVAVIHYSNFNDSSLYADMVLVMGVGIAFSFPFKSYSSILDAEIRFHIVSIIQSAKQIIQALLMVIFLVYGFGLLGLAYSFTIATIMESLLYYLATKKSSIKVEYEKKFLNKKTILALLSYSFKTFVAQLAEILRTKTDELVTGTFISVSSVTFYSVANRLNLAANNFCFSFLGVLTPVFSQNIKSSQEVRTKQFFSASKVMIALSSMMFFGLLFLGKPFIVLWVGQDYLSSYNPLAILALSYYIGLIQAVSVSYMYSANTHHYFASFSLLEGIGNLAFTFAFVLIFNLGISGVALGTLVSISIVKIAIQPVIMAKLLGIRLRAYYFFFIKNIFLGLALYFPLGIIIETQSNIDDYFELAIYIFVYFLLSGLHLFLELTKEEKKIVWGKIPLILENRIIS